MSNQYLRRPLFPEGRLQLTAAWFLVLFFLDLVLCSLIQCSFWGLESLPPFPDFAFLCNIYTDFLWVGNILDFCGYQECRVPSRVLYVRNEFVYLVFQFIVGSERSS